MFDVVVLFFVLGVFARAVKSDLALPAALYETLSIFLLLAIGLKGGVELAKQPIASLAPQVLACMALGFAIPFVLFAPFRWAGLSRVDAAAVAAHYGSVSVVTFAVVSAFLAERGAAVESHAALWVAVMEVPGIVAGIVLARSGKSDGASVPWKALAHEVFAGKSVVLLVGGLVIGAVAGQAGVAPIKLLFVDLFKGVLALFLLELGLVAGARLGDMRSHGLRLLLLGTLTPLALSSLGLLLGSVLGLSIGGMCVMATLAASASYIAAPTAIRMAVPEANAGLAITAALVVTFPFNLLVGIPLYWQAAQWLHGMTA